MNLGEIEQLTTWLKASGLRCLELSRPDESLKICVSDRLDVEVVQSPLVNAGMEEVSTHTSLVDIKAGTPGIFLSTHPMRVTPFISIGDEVKVNSMVGLLKVDHLYLPIYSSVCGRVKSITASTGELLGYGSTVLTLETSGS